MASVNAGESLSLPTAIGFCMFVSREAWQQAGGFDERYGRGYGEEVEFCLSTRRKAGIICWPVTYSFTTRETSRSGMTSN